MIIRTFAFIIQVISWVTFGMVSAYIGVAIPGFTEWMVAASLISGTVFTYISYRGTGYAGFVLRVIAVASLIAYGICAALKSFPGHPNVFWIFSFVFLLLGVHTNYKNYRRTYTLIKSRIF